MKISSFSALKVVFFFAFGLVSFVWGDLGPSNVLVLVNQNSNSSRYIAKLYQKYHPTLPSDQILYLSNLTDACGPQSTAANEIITMADYKQYIAEPVRQYLLDEDHPTRLANIRVILTTAGMPYRISDPNYYYAVTPAASSASVISLNTKKIVAASVESELTCLWICDYGISPSDLENRLVNPYQGYRYSPFSLFERETPGSKTFIWNLVYNAISAEPLMEGELYPPFPPPPGTSNRMFNAGDMYLTSRLDGPKEAGKTAVFAVRAMLERAKRASNSAQWGGVNPLQSVAVFDDSPNSLNDFNREFNLDGSVNYWVYDAQTPQPPDAPTILCKDDYVSAFVSMTELGVDYNVINCGTMVLGYDLGVILDRRVTTRTDQDDLAVLLAAYPDRNSNQLLVALSTYGKNDDVNNPATYLLTGGPGGGPLFQLANGAVFTSIESFNNVTMFTEPSTGQAKIVDFITIGGAGAIGHAFEPIRDACADTGHFIYNLFADMDEDGWADLTFVEAAFTAIPYLSWAETVIGDPLMRFQYGTGGAAWKQLPGDANNDGVVNNRDVKPFLDAYYAYGALNSTTPSIYEAYNDLCDFNQDAVINGKDVRIFLDNLYGM